MVSGNYILQDGIICVLGVRGESLTTFYTGMWGSHAERDLLYTLKIYNALFLFYSQAIPFPL